MIELERNQEDMYIYDFEIKEMDFGERGRKEISDKLLGERETNI